MRKGFDGLCGLVHTELGRRPEGGEVFIFVNRQRDKIKLLHWEEGGFVLPRLWKTFHKLGWKNYLFAGSHEAAQQAAMIYSFLGTCKINNVEPYSWLKETLTRIPDQSIQKLDELLPR